MRATANDNGVRSADVVVLGGGLSGQLAVIALAERAPHLSVALIERAEHLGGNHAWCCHGADLAHPAEDGAMVLSWFLPLVSHCWPSHRVSFPTHERILESDYLCLRSRDLASMTEQALDRPGTSLLTNREVTMVERNHVELSSGEVVSGRLVLDARGEEPAAYAGRTAFQKFVGWEIELEASSAAIPQMPTLMDAKVPQPDGFRFVYVLPFSPRRALIEDTYFSSTPGLDREAVRGRLVEYLHGLGVIQYRILREESGVLPMPWGTSRRQPGEVVAIGYRGGFFHPGTGYSLARSVIVAHRIARLAGEAGNADLSSLIANGLAELGAFWEDDNRFARRLNYLAFRLLPGRWLRDLVFSAVYRLPHPTLARYYAGRTSTGDRLALVGAPLRFSKADVDRRHRSVLGACS